VRDEQMTRGDVLPGYTARDLLARSAAWDGEVLAALEAYLNGREPYRVEMGDPEMWSLRVRDARRGLPLIQTRMHWLMVRGELGSLLAISPPQVLDDIIEYPWGERGTIRHLVEHHCIDRDLEYAAAIRAWRTRENI
jgi:hypothetical protein